MEFEFSIPTRNSDLLNADGNKYCVNRVYSPQEINDKLKSAKQAFSSSHQSFYIFDHFDTIFSVIENAANLQNATLINSTNLLWVTCDKLGQMLADYFQLPPTDQTEREQYLTSLKMLVYLSIANVRAIDKVVSTANEKIIKKGKKQQTSSEVESLDWDKRRYKVLLQLHNLLLLPLENLWDPPVVEESFVNLCADMAYRTLEHPSIHNRDILLTSFQILGSCIKRFNHAPVFPVRITQIVELCESSIVPIAEGIGVLYEDFGITTVYAVLIKQMLEHLCNEDLRSDSQASKHFGIFFTHVANSEPAFIMPHVSTLADEILNMESHTLRNCILTIMSDIIIKKLTSEELNDEHREMRDEFLEDLLNHMQDVSAHVRSKVLQLWSNLKNENAVPLMWQHKVLMVAVERLEDKTSLVRKHAIALIRSFLECNPFSAKLNVEELQTRYEEEKKKLTDVREKMVAETSRIDALTEEWETILKEMQPAIEEILTMESIDSIEVTDDERSNILNYFGDFVREKRYRQLMAVLRSAEEKIGNYDEIKDQPLELKSMYYEQLLRSYFLLRNNFHDYEKDFKAAESAVKFLEDSIEFSQIIINAVPKLQEMLMSRTNSDVFETIEFFTAGYLFGIKNTECGMQQMLFLVWSSDKEKKSAVIEAYKKVLWKTDQQGRAHSVSVVKNLLRFLEGLTDGHYIALEELVREWIENNDIDSQMIQVMFEIYTKKLENITENESRLALQLLILCSSAKSSIATANFDLLINIGFQDASLQDSRIFAATIQMAMNSIPDQTENPSKFYKRLNETDENVAKIIEVFHKYFFCPMQFDFDEVCSKVISFIFTFCKKPDEVCKELLYKIYNRLLELSSSLASHSHANDIENEANDQRLSQDPVIRLSQATQATQTQEAAVRQNFNIPVIFLSRLIFMIGYVAMRELIYLDINVYSNMKYREELKKNPANKEPVLATPVPSSSNKRKTIGNESATSAKRTMETPAKDKEKEDEEEDVVGASAEDNVADQIFYICEKEMLFSKDSLFRKLIPIILEVIKFHQRYKDTELQQSAVLALIRVMTVSSEFCENNIPFLMNVFRHTKNIKIKCNIIIGMSDFTFRFPNVIDPWSGHLYSTLHDSDVELRLTTVKILSHLIAHEMILVKGQISDLALCLVDENLEIKQITGQFFKEIANKSNILYNSLPDIISRLSDPNLSLEEGKYQIIMRHIVGLIQKDRQIEGLVEKLCFRFKVTVIERQWRDIAFCLSLLSYNERTIKKLIENVKHFKDKVQVDEVYDAFKTIINNTNKLAKPELKAVVSEFEAKLEQCLAVREGGENQANTSGEAENLMPPPALPLRKPVGKTKPAQKGKNVPKGRTAPSRGRRQQDSSSESENSDSDSELENHPPASRGKKAATASASAKSGRNVHTKVIEESSSSDEDQQKPPSKRGRGKK